MALRNESAADKGLSITINEDQMSRLHIHPETHLVDRIGWLRAAVLGANDGIVSTASLIVGVAAASAKPTDILIAGVAGLVAGAMSMAAGEYVSVSSQSDTERADIARERKELAENVGFEREELAQIYVKRGVDLELARRVADQLIAKDALGAQRRKRFRKSYLRSNYPETLRRHPCRAASQKILPPVARLLIDGLKVAQRMAHSPGQYFAEPADHASHRARPSLLPPLSACSARPTRSSCHSRRPG